MRNLCLINLYLLSSEVLWGTFMRFFMLTVCWETDRVWNYVQLSSTNTTTTPLPDVNYPTVLIYKIMTEYNFSLCHLCLKLTIFGNFVIQLHWQVNHELANFSFKNTVICTQKFKFEFYFRHKSSPSPSLQQNVTHSQSLKNIFD